MDRKIFDQDQAVVAEKAEVARQLAKKHYQAEVGLLRIFRLMGSTDVEVKPLEPIKLLKMNTNTIASGVLPVSFGPAPASGIPYPSVIVEVSPAVFGKTVAPASSNRSRDGGNEIAEAFDGKVCLAVPRTGRP
jgi:hypothetical protein